MGKIDTDIEFNNIIHEITSNEEFKKINNNVHHGTTRMKHSLRVSYCSYKISKGLKLDYRNTARGGLLHDFYTYNDKKTNDRVLCFFKHPNYALINSENNFILSDKEKNIILSHMFPTTINKVPKYVESWIVSIVDKIVATYELWSNYQKKIKVRHSQTLILLTLVFSRIL